MTEIDSKTMLQGIGNDFKILIDDVIGVILTIQEDVEKLKIKTSKPNKTKAKAILDYLGMDEGTAKQNLEILCGEEIKESLKWIDTYCKENACSQEEALNEIIDE